MNLKTRLLLEYLVIATILIALSFTPLKIVAILAPIVYLVIEFKLRKRTRKGIGFDFKATPANIKTNLHLILLVVIVLPLASALIGKFFVPEYFSHLVQRVSPYIALDANSFDKIFFNLLFLAFGEEIVFRAFLQGRLSMFVNPVLSILIASVVFAGVHYSPSKPLIVGMDLASVFADSLVFGFLFKRTNNVYTTTVAHFLGNFFGIILLIVGAHSV